MRNRLAGKICYPAWAAMASFLLLTACTSSAPSAELRSPIASDRVSPIPSLNVLARVDIGAQIRGLTAGDEGLWVLTWDDQVLRIDPATNTAGPPVAVGFPAWDLAEGQGHVWVAPNGGSVAGWLDPASNRIEKTPDAGVPLQLVAAGPSGVWFASDSKNEVLPFDRSTGRFGQPWNIPPEPTGMVVIGRTLWVSTHSTGQVIRFDLRNGHRTVISDPLSIHFIAFGDGRLWVSHYHDDALTRISASTNLVIPGRIRLDFPPGPMAVGGGAVWVAQANPGLEPGPFSLARIDAGSGKVLDAFHLSETPQDLALWHGSLWVALQTGIVLRIELG
jgi:streptogramin lyase